MKWIRRVGLTCLVLFLTACRMDLYHSLQEEEANQMLAILLQHHIDADKKKEEGGITLSVDHSQFINAVELLRLNGFPRRNFVTADAMFPPSQLVVSPMEEQQKITFLKEQRVAGMLSQMDGIVSASVTIATLPTEGESSIHPSSVAVFIKYSPQINIDSFRTSIKDLIQKSIPGLQYNQISVLMQPAELRMVVGSEESQTGTINTSDGEIMLWLKRYSRQLAIMMLGLLVSLLSLLGYHHWRKP